MISQDDIDALKEFNEPLNEKESEEKSKKLKDLTENQEFLTESGYSVRASFRLSTI